jgi:hypothetical protein
MDHGFYMFSPTLFWDFYSANKYEINLFQVFRYTERPAIDLWEVSNYTPGCLDAISSGGLDDARYAIFCVVTKNADSTGDKIPQQGTYVTTWGLNDNILSPSTEEMTSEGEAIFPEAEAVSSTFEKIKDVVRPIPVVFPVAHYLMNMARKGYSLTRTPQKETLAPQEEMPPKKGLGLKIIARY